MPVTLGLNVISCFLHITAVLFAEDTSHLRVTNNFLSTALSPSRGPRRKRLVESEDIIAKPSPFSVPLRHPQAPRSWMPGRTGGPRRSLAGSTANALGTSGPRPDPTADAGCLYRFTLSPGSTHRPGGRRGPSSPRRPPPPLRAEAAAPRGGPAPSPPKPAPLAPGGLQAAGLGDGSEPPAPPCPGSHGRRRAVAAEAAPDRRLQQGRGGGKRAASPRAGEADGPAAGGGRPVRRWVCVEEGGSPLRARP